MLISFELNFKQIYPDKDLNLIFNSEYFLVLTKFKIAWHHDRLQFDKLRSSTFVFIEFNKWLIRMNLFSSSVIEIRDQRFLIFLWLQTSWIYFVVKLSSPDYQTISINIILFRANKNEIKQILPTFYFSCVCVYIYIYIYGN